MRIFAVFFLAISLITNSFDVLACVNIKTLQKDVNEPRKVIETFFGKPISSFSIFSTIDDSDIVYIPTHDPVFKWGNFNQEDINSLVVYFPQIRNKNFYLDKMLNILEDKNNFRALIQFSLADLLVYRGFNSSDYTPTILSVTKRNYIRQKYSFLYKEIQFLKMNEFLILEDIYKNFSSRELNIIIPILHIEGISEITWLLYLANGRDSQAAIKSRLLSRVYSNDHKQMLKSYTELDKQEEKDMYDIYLLRTYETPLLEFFS